MGRNRNRRQAKSLKRKVETRNEFHTIIVFCEGKKSEPDYVKGLMELPHISSNTTLQIEVWPEQGAPLTLVNMAVEAKSNSEVDECWCLFDVEWPENHPNLDKALDKAKANSVGLAISNPCFEMWLILHFEDCSRFMTSAAAESLSRKLDGRKGKSIDPSIYMPKRRDAARRAKSLKSRHFNNGTNFPDNNPSSGMFEFLESLENFHRTPPDSSEN